MKKVTSALLLLFIGVSCFAQKSPVKYGDIPMEDLRMTIYDKDSSAVALILADYGKAYISSSTIATLNFERHMRIKILKKEGLSWADASIPLYQSGSTEERLSNLKATTYNLENGQVVESKMSRDGVFKEKYNRNITLQKFTFPNVKEGSVIEYSYTIVSGFLDRFPNWQFQYDIPSRLTEYWAIIPEFFQMERYMQGYLAPSGYEVKDRTQSGYNEKAHHWTITNVPAFREEPFMTSEEDYVSKINFALAYVTFPGQQIQEIMGSWEKLTKNLLESEYFGRVITGSGFLKKEVEQILAGKTEPLVQVEALHNHIKTTLEWNGTKDFTADPLKEIFEKKKGTSGDINLALASMLEKAGFTVDMVLLSTRDHGFIRKQYPMSKQFNYVVCRVKVGDKYIFLDATEKFIPVDVLPERCLNGEGMVVAKVPVWINITPKTKAKSTIISELILAEDGALAGTLTYNRDGYDALHMRKSFSSKGQETYMEDFKKGKTWQIEKSSFENVDAIDKPATEVHTIALGEHTSSAGDLIYINPFITAKLEENPFKLEKREYPVDFGSLQEKTYMCKILLPDNYAVDELPQSKMITLPGNTARYLYNVSQLGNTVNITSTFQTTKTLFTQEEYPRLREFYNLVVAKQAEQIVLKKK